MCSMKYPNWEELLEHTFVGRHKFPLIEDELPTFLGVPHVTSKDELKGQDVVIIGAPYVATATDRYAGVDKWEWISGPKRVRQQSVRYGSGYIQDFDIDVFEHLNVVDYGDADIPEEVNVSQTPENILKAQASVEEKVGDVLEAGGIPIVIGQNSPLGSFAIAKSISEHTAGQVGCVSLDTHWDAAKLDRMTNDPRIAGSGSWKHKMYEFLENMHPSTLVEIGERGMLEKKDIVRRYLREGARFISSWEVRSLGIEGVVKELDWAYQGTDGVYVHFDMDVLGGAGPASGDIMGELAEPIGLTDYEVIRIAHEVGRRGLSGMSFICIPPGSAVIYRVIVYVIMYLMAGLALEKARK